MHDLIVVIDFVIYVHILGDISPGGVSSG